MIKKIQLKNIRNHKFLELQFNQSFAYIHGLNGSGKTSVLEAIYFCATTKSHRTNDEKDVITQGEPFASVKLWQDDDRYEVVLSKTGKRASINGVEKRKISDFIGHLRIVMFAPEDLELIQGSPQDRRQFVDLEWMQLNKNYLRHLNTYKQVLKQRNSLLKKITIDDDYTFLNILGDQLYEVGSKIILERKTFVEELNHYFRNVYQRFSKHDVEFMYQPDVDEKTFLNALKKNQKQDILYQTTLIGPHRDDFIFRFNGFEAKSYASQGEQRLMVIALKLALLELIKEKTHQSVTLLLDDVLSELDEERQKLFLKELPKEHQIIMNSTHPIEGDHIQMIYLKKEL
jgi:DNA replication and repair protein RecF